MPTFASQSGKRLHRLAKIAQLVEHDLAKVGVAGSSPVCRSLCLCIYRDFFNGYFYTILKTVPTLTGAVFNSTALPDLGNAVLDMLFYYISDLADFIDLADHFIS